MQETMAAGQEPGMRLPGAGNTIPHLHTSPQSPESKLLLQWQPAAIMDVNAEGVRPIIIQRLCTDESAHLGLRRGLRRTVNPENSDMPGCGLALTAHTQVDRWLALNRFEWTLEDRPFACDLRRTCGVWSGMSNSAWTCLTIRRHQGAQQLSGRVQAETSPVGTAAASA